MILNNPMLHNKAVKVRRLSAARLNKNMFGFRPLHVFVPPHFCGCWNCVAIPSSQPQKRWIPRTLGEIITEIISGNYYIKSD
jgi:hypothetical protein